MYAALESVSANTKPRINHEKTQTPNATLKKKTRNIRNRNPIETNAKRKAKKRKRETKANARRTTKP